jgi:serine/threonine protein phosphatase PrpC
MTAALPSIPAMDTDIGPCPQCGEDNPPEETFCLSCGVALDEESDTTLDTLTEALSPLAVGDVVAERWIVESVETHGDENRYQARGQGQDGQDGTDTTQVILRERASENAESLLALEARVAKLAGLAGAADSAQPAQPARSIHPALLIPEPSVEYEGRVYVAFPHVAGMPLADRIGLTSEREVVGWGVQLCQILGFLHRHDLLCLELPPEGVILDKTGRLRLAQFETLTETKTGKGSQHEPLFLSDGYSAPELYKSGELHETADIFALGAVLYSLVVGLRLPTESWVVQPEPPLFYPEKVLSPDLERVLRQALAFQAEDRYQTVGELKSALLELTHETGIRSAWRTDVGQWRDHNEDAVLVKEVGQGTIDGNTSRGLYIVADGMGGAEAGEIASEISITVVAEHIEQAWSQDQSDNADNVERDDAAWEVCLREAVEAANTAIVGYAKAHPEAEGMGSTIVAVLLTEHSQILAWVGDSRIYLLEGGQLIQLSRDHSLVERLVEIGQLTPEEARTHEHRNVLIRSLGSKEQVTVDTLTRPFKRGARLLLCSDGLTSHVEDSALADILSRHREPRDAALELVVAANTGGGSDNVSVIVVFNE